MNSFHENLLFLTVFSFLGLHATYAVLAWTGPSLATALAPVTCLACIFYSTLMCARHAVPHSRYHLKGCSLNHEGSDDECSEVAATTNIYDGGYFKSESDAEEEEGYTDEGDAEKEDDGSVESESYVDFEEESDAEDGNAEDDAEDGNAEDDAEDAEDGNAEEGAEEGNVEDDTEEGNVEDDTEDGNTEEDAEEGNAEDDAEGNDTGSELSCKNPKVNPSTRIQ